MSLLALMVLESNTPSIAVVNGLHLESSANGQALAQTELTSRME